jgi:hypothetical protein
MLTSPSSSSSCFRSNCNTGIATATSEKLKYWDKNVCEAGYNETASLAGQNMLKSKGPFHIMVAIRHGLSLLSIYFSGCGKVFRQGLKKSIFNDKLFAKAIIF